MIDAAIWRTHMRNQIKSSRRPWLTSTGVEIPTADLKPISRTWGIETWGKYLRWYQGARREKLIRPTLYDKSGDELTENIFEEFSQDSSQENRDLCEHVLARLPSLEALVLRRHFLEGRTDAEIAFGLNRSRTGVSLIKNRAISRLKRGNSGDGVSPCPFMRVDGSEECFGEPTIWEIPLPFPLTENRRFSADAHRAEFEQMKIHYVRDALMSLSDRVQRILYLRFWCGLSIGTTARVIGCGVNVVSQIEEASISKLKRHALDLGGFTLGGEPCA